MFSFPGKWYCKRIVPPKARVKIDAAEQHKNKSIITFQEIFGSGCITNLSGTHPDNSFHPSQNKDFVLKRKTEQAWAALLKFTCKKIFHKEISFTKTELQFTTVHHLYNHEGVGLPVDNMRRCLLSPNLYQLLGFCRCYFLEQYPSEETRDVITLKPTLFSAVCLTQ